MNTKTWWPALGLFGLLTPLAPEGLAQEAPARWIVSTTSTVPDTPETQALMDRDDACLFRVTNGEEAFAHATRGNWFAMAGMVPGDIDGVAFRSPGTSAAHREGLVFSLLSNEAGFLDGDVLGLGFGGGLERVVAEEDIALALGVPGAALDLDGLDFDGEGRLVFSLQADITGTMLGDVERGDVLRMEGPGAVSRLATTDDVQFALDMAAASIGVASGALGDVHGIAVVGADLFVVVQSPSSMDGAILRMGVAPKLVMDEAAVGLAGAELDALAALPAGFDVGAIALDQHTAVPGIAVHGEGHGFTPGAPVLLMMAGAPGPGLALGVGGFGELLMDPTDSFWLGAFGGAFPVEVADGMGRFAVDFGLPGSSVGAAWAGTTGWSFQAFDLGNQSLTAPFRVQVF